MLTEQKVDEIVKNKSDITYLKSGQVFTQIKKFINTKKYKSEKTAEAYEHDIRRFFKVMKDKDIEHLTVNDIQITLDEFEEFIAMMHDKTEYNNKTINRNLTSVKEILKYLYGKKLVNDISYITADQVKSLPTNNINSYGCYTLEEVFTLSELARTEEKELQDEKYFLILLSLDTCLRKSALLKLTWNSFDVKNDCVLIKAVDKGNKDFRPKISKEFFCELKSIKRQNNPYVFSIKPSTVDKMIKRLNKKMKLEKERHLVFHSIRKAGVTYQYRITGDILQAQKAANHSNITTTQIYLQDEDYGIVGAVSSKGKINLNIFDNLSKEELIELIKTSHQTTQFILAKKAQEMFNFYD